jgi:hypothetical protein
MKKSMFKYFAYSFVAAAALTLGSCSSDEHYDVTGNPDNLVYFNLGGDNTRSYKVIHTPVSHIGAFDAKFPAKILRPADGSITVSVAVDNSLVEQFNAANGTSYAVVPDGVVSLTNAVAHIQPNEYASSDSIQVSVPESALPKLTEEGYMVPLRISEVQGSGKASEERGVAYIVIKTSEELINDAASEVIGSAIDLSTAKCVAATNLDASRFQQLVNGRTWQFQTRSDKASFTVDLGETRNVTGLLMSVDLGDNYDMFISADGNNWISLGNCTEHSGPRVSVGWYGYTAYVLFGAVPTRFVKFDMTLDVNSFYWNYQSWGYCGVEMLNIYAE